MTTTRATGPTLHHARRVDKRTPLSRVASSTLVGANARDRHAPTGRDDSGEPDCADSAPGKDRVPRNQLLSDMHDSFNVFIADLVQITGVFDILKVAMAGLIAFMRHDGKDVGDAIVRGRQFVQQNGPLIVGIIVGGITPAIIGMALAFGAATLALAPYLIARAVLGFLAQTILTD